VVDKVVIKMVDKKEDLGNAIALNSSMVNRGFWFRCFNLGALSGFAKKYFWT
jgi:hypothetical protein